MTTNTKFEAVLSNFFSTAKSMPDMNYEIHIHVGDMSAKAVAVVEYRVVEDYVANIFEAIVTSALFTVFDYSALMMAGHEDMYATVISRPYDGGKAFRTKYRAILLNSGDQRVEGNTDLVNNIGKLDQQSFATATFQLISPAAYDIRMRGAGGVFKDTDATSVLKYILSQNMLADSYSKEEAIQSITFDAHPFPTRYSRIVVPDGTELTKLGDYLQDHYGVYGTGFGIFLKDRSWYVYSPYNYDKGKESIDKLIIFNAPPNKYSGIPENILIEGNTVKIAASGDTSMIKTSDTNALNSGTGRRFADSTMLMEYDSNDPANEKPKLEPHRYMTEYTGVEYKNQFKNTKMVDGRFSSNPAKVSSEMAASAGIIVTTVWQNGIMDCLIPGMPVEFIYGVDMDVVTLKGTLLRAEMHSHIPTGGIVEPRHRNSIALSIFLKEV